MAQFQGDEKFIPKRINNEWVKRFKTFLQDKELNDNSVAKYMTILKKLKSFLSPNGIKIPAELEKMKLVEREQIVNILEKQELELIEKFEFDSDYLSQIRDVFLFQCYTGQRYSDIEKITRSCISTKGSHNVWLLSTQKTDDNLIVPLNKRAMAILEKYQNLDTTLPRFTNQYFNRELKEMAKTAKLTRIVKQVCFYNNIKQEQSMPLHDAISSHMARKSFISLSTQKGIPERFVRDVSGNKSERSFKRYLNLGDAHLHAILKAWD
jgi:site-specific recombinase XerD